MGRPRDDDSALRAAILKLLSADGWTSQRDLAEALPRGLLAPESTGRQQLSRTLARMEAEDHSVIRSERIPGQGRGPFWRRLAGPLKFEVVHHELFEHIRKEAYEATRPPIQYGSTAEVYFYGDVQPAAFAEGIERALAILRSAGSRVSRARARLAEALRLLHGAGDEEALARRILENLVRPLPAQRVGILVVPFISKVGRGPNVPIAHVRTKTADGRVVRRVGWVNRPGKKRA